MICFQFNQKKINYLKRDLGGGKIIDIEDNAINGGTGSKPERVVFILLENEGRCESSCQPAPLPVATPAAQPFEDACLIAPKLNSPTFDSPCYNGGKCISGSTNGNTNKGTRQASLNYSCVCPTGFTGPLCEVNIDDCTDHQCQNGAMCVDEVNAYKCICRDPTTSGEFCEQLSPTSSFATNSANSIGPIALPMVSFGTSADLGAQLSSPSVAQSTSNNQQNILARSADFYQPPGNQISNNADISQSDQKLDCKRTTQRKYYQDGKGCQSVRMLKISECAGSCSSNQTPALAGCCLPAKVKRRRIRMQCNDGASYVKTIDLVKKCACSAECQNNHLNSNHHNHNNQAKNYDWTTSNQQQNSLIGQYNATQEDQLLQITRLDAVE